MGQAKGEELLQLLSRQEEGSDSEEEEEEEDDDDDDDDEDEEEEEDGDGDDDQQQHDDPEDENLLRAEPLPNADSIQAVPQPQPLQNQKPHLQCRRKGRLLPLRHFPAHFLCHSQPVSLSSFCTVVQHMCTPK